MAEQTEISWADATFNPWIGCTKVGAGCDHCYAERDNARRKWVDGWGPSAPRRRTSGANWRQPLMWDRRAQASGKLLKVFCASLADVFDNEVPPEWRADLFALIRATPNLRWMLLTKRIGNAAKMLPLDWPYPNAGLMATVVNQPEADRDVPKLLATSATWRGVSIEPMLGPIDLTLIARQERAGSEIDRHWTFIDDALTGFRAHKCGGSFGPKLDFVILGGESGPDARPMHPAWARSLRNQCAAADVAFHFKQWGEWTPIVPGRWEGDPDAVGSVFTPDHRPGDVWFSDDGWSGPKPPRIWDPDHFAIMRRVGRKKAGWLLDGCEHKEFPSALVAQ